MAILFYIRTRLRRSVLQSMSILLLFAALLAFFGFFEGFLSKKEQELDAAWNTVPVTVTVSNLTGTKEEDLDIHGYLVNYFLSDRYLFEGRDPPKKSGWATPGLSATGSRRRALSLSCSLFSVCTRFFRFHGAAPPSAQTAPSVFSHVSTHLRTFPSRHRKSWRRPLEHAHHRAGGDTVRGRLPPVRPFSRRPYAQPGRKHRCSSWRRRSQPR